DRGLTPLPLLRVRAGLRPSSACILAAFVISTSLIGRDALWITAETPTPPGHPPRPPAAGTSCSRRPAPAPASPPWPPPPPPPTRRPARDRSCPRSPWGLTELPG